MSIFDRVRAGAASRIQARSNSISGGALSAGVGIGTNAAGKQITRLLDLQNQGVRRALESVNGDTVLGKAVLDTAKQFGFRLNRKPSVTVRESPERALWTAAPVWGGLELNQSQQLFNDSAMLAKAWKNLFHVSISESSSTKGAPNGVPASFALLATDVTFAPYTAPGDVTQIGGANIDNLHASDRVEMQITTLDDARGSIKRWFDGKMDQAVHRDGTFGLPSEYLVVIRVTHMDPLNQTKDSDRFKQIYRMRPAGRSTELSRRDHALEELQLSFVQFDTFMEVA